MVGQLFEQARLDPPECPVDFLQSNLPEIVKSDVSPFVIVEMAGQLAVGQFEQGAEDDMIALINDRRIRGDKRPARSFITSEAMK